MNNERRKNQEIELLSAYLDQALEPGDKKRLESRLEKEPKLKEALDNLRKTKIMLGYLPHLKAPRNFTLTPQMVKVRSPKKRPSFLFVRWATSLAAIFLVALFGVELFLGGGFITGRKMSEAPLMESAVLEEDASPEPLILWSGQDSPGGTGGGGSSSDAVGVGGETYIMEEPMEEPAMAEEADRKEVEAEEQAPPPEEAEAMTEAEIESVPQEVPEALTMAEQDEEANMPILGINADDAGEIIESSEPATTERVLNPRFQSIIFWLQIILGVITVGGALILLVLHIKQKRLT